jgi:hypothetical protein
LAYAGVFGLAEKTAPLSVPSGNPLYENSLRPPGLSTGALEIFQWKGENPKRSGWRGRSYQLTDSDTANYNCLQPSTDTHVHTSHPERRPLSGFVKGSERYKIINKNAIFSWRSGSDSL